MHTVPKTPTRSLGRRLRAVVILGASVPVGACGITDPPRTGVRLISGPSLRDTAMAYSSEPFVVEIRDSHGGFRSPAIVSVRSSPAPGADGPFPEAVQILAAPEGEGGFFGSITLDANGRAKFWVKRGQKAGPATITVTAFDVEGKIELTIEPGRAAKIHPVPADTVIYVDATYSLRATVTDQWGNDRPEPVQLTAGPGLSVSPAGVVTAREVGRRVVQLTSGEVTGQAWVSVPPRGMLAAMSGPTYIESIVVLNLDGSGWRTVRAPPDAYSPQGAPQWSPDGQELVFHAAPGGFGTVSYRTDLAGNVRQLFGADAPRRQIYPRFSRDGQWLFFSGGEDVSAVSIYRARGDGSAPVRVGVEPYDPQTEASPSPDGTRVVYLAKDFYSSINAPVIRVLNLVTGVVARLEIYGYSPRWSPTAERIAYVEASGHVVLMDPNGGNRRVISAPGRSYDLGLDWSPDGQWLVARSRELPILALIHAETGETLPLMFSKQLDQPAWRPTAP